MGNQMTKANLKQYRLGWVGTGRMGYAMASRLLQNGCDVAVYNRTRAKAQPLAEYGATLVDSPADLADRDIIFTMVSGPDDLIEVVSGDHRSVSIFNMYVKYERTVSLSMASRFRERRVPISCRPVEKGEGGATRRRLDRHMRGSDNG